MAAQITSAGANWTVVRHDVAWIDGRHGSAQAALPPIDAEPRRQRKR